MNQPTAPNYNPIPGSLPQRVLDWFAKNPEEELTAGDIAAKFAVSASANVSPSLATPITHDLLRRAPGGVYAIGPRFAAWQQARSQAMLEAALAHAPIKHAQPRRASAAPIDPDAIELRPGVIAPRGGQTACRAESLRSQLLRLLGRMEPDTHVILPLDYRHTAADALTHWRKTYPKQKLSLRVDADAITINRHA